MVAVPDKTGVPRSRENNMLAQSLSLSSHIKNKKQSVYLDCDQTTKLNSVQIIFMSVLPSTSLRSMHAVLAVIANGL